MAGQLMTERPQSRTWLRRLSPAALREEMEELFSEMLPSDGGTWFGGRSVPSLDLSETDSAVEVHMDVPGLKPTDIDIQINANLLTVSGRRKEEKEEKGRTYHRIERRSGSFSRTVTLPCAVKEDKVDAQYRDGVLSITLPKTEAAKAHKIKVQG